MKNKSSINVYKDICVEYAHKYNYNNQRNKTKIYFGDVPVCSCNAITGLAEETDNKRGRAYAARLRLKHRDLRKPIKKYKFTKWGMNNEIN